MLLGGDGVVYKWDIVVVVLSYKQSVVVVDEIL